MRPLFPLLPSLALLLAACGGGADGGLPPQPSTGATLKGSVVAVNGQSTAVSGVALRALSTGASDVSADDGTFHLGSVPPGRQMIEVRTERGDDLEIEVEVEENGVVHIGITVTDDGVERQSEDHCSDDGRRAEARARLAAEEAGLDGHVTVRKDDDGDQGFDVEAEHLAPGRSVDIVVIDAETGNEETLARLTADGSGEAELELRTDDGELLPLGVTDVADLADVRVEVRDAGTGLPILAGEVPSIGSLPPCRDHGDDDDDGDDDHGDDDDQDRSGEARLTNQGRVSGTARVELRSRPTRGEEKFEIEVSGTNAGGALEAWLEDPANRGTLVMVGLLTPENDGLEFERETDDGEALPFGVPSASGLVGLTVEVRRASDGAVLFAGTTPPVRMD